MLRWSAHLTFLFREHPLLDRFQAAAAAGFGAVELVWENELDPDALVRAKQNAGIEVALIGIDLGDLERGERGVMNLPDRREWWRARAQAALDLAARLDVQRINVLSGNVNARFSHQEMMDCIYGNLEWLLPRVQANGACLVIEPLNRFDNPHYLFGHTKDAVQVIEKFNDPALKLQLDLYHVQRSEGNVARVLQACAPHLAHLQIADSPDRHQPGTGELNWRYLFEQVEALGYAGYVGLEYHPVPDTLGSLAWLPPEKRRVATARDIVYPLS